MGSRSLPASLAILVLGVGIGVVIGLFVGRSDLPEDESSKMHESSGGRNTGSVTHNRIRFEVAQEKRKLLPGSARDAAVADYLAKFTDAKRTLGGDLQIEAYRELVRGAAMELGCSNHLVALRDALAAEGIAGWAVSELMHESVIEALKTGDPKAHLANWQDLENEKVKLHSASYLGAILSAPQIDELVATGVDGGMREYLVSGYAKSFAATDPAGALRAFLKHCSPGASLLGDITKQIQPNADFPHLLTILPKDEPGRPLQAREFMLRRWAWSDPQAAANHIRDTAGTMSPKHLGRVLETWAHHPARHEEVANWAAALPRGSLRDQAAASLVSRLVPTHPNRVWALALSMTDEEEGWRTKTLQRVYEQWHRFDSDAAEAALDSLEQAGE